jgi:hypothetical protein
MNTQAQWPRFAPLESRAGGSVEHAVDERASAAFEAHG